MLYRPYTLIIKTTMDLNQNHIGYGGSPPHVLWPNGARICVSFVINYEEGGERNILNGDSGSESYLTEIIGTDSLKNDRNFVVESCYEYGSRVGIYRLLSLFRKHDIQTTIYAVGKALEKNPNICKLFMEDKHDIASHQFRWINYRDTTFETEKHHLVQVMGIHKRLCDNQTPKGIYTGSISNHTKQILYEYNDSVHGKQDKEKIVWHSDCYNDDIPYWDYDAFTLYSKCKDGVPLLNIPYTLTTNDFRYLLPNGFITSDQFFTFCKDTFDALLREGGKMMTIGLHARISGHAGRLVGIQRFVEYITHRTLKDKVWIATRSEIAQFWSKTYPPSPVASKSGKMYRAKL
eukprot:210853_1